MSNFSIKPDALKSCSGTLDSCSQAMRKYSKEITSIMNSLDPSLSEVKPALSMIISNTAKHAEEINTLNTALNDIVDAYSHAERNISIKINSVLLIDKPLVYDGDGSEVFDNDGSYGGNQANIRKHTNIFPFKFWFLGRDNDLYDFIRSHPGYENYTNDQIKALLKEITDVGCGFVACANTIFSEYEGRAAEFEKTFGFPMYGPDGDFNFDMLTIDFYLETQNKFYIGKDDILGEDALQNKICSYYKNHPDEFKSKYGMDLLDSNGDVTDVSWNKINEEAQDLIDSSDGECVIYGNEPTGINYLATNNRLNHYLSERGIDSFSYSESETLSNSEIQAAIDSNKTVIISAKDFTLYTENGDIYDKNIGPHAMVVTGITPEGDYIVSSWGKKYIYKPNETTASGDPTTVHYNVCDIFVD